MREELIEMVEKETESIKLKRHQLIYIVQPSLKKDLRVVSQKLNVPYINLNLELSKELMDVPLIKRPRKVNQLVKQIVKDHEARTLVLDHIEILFDQNLQQNPGILLEDVSRNVTLIVGWKGSSQHHKLIYGEPGHNEYFTYDNPEGIIINDN
ncbi:BREX-3 system P-loop-containing protein BrxF [Alkalibacillus haloalkaliphilus]|uniref:BREX-3 system P-loop-containing protein BrxF n=1 Tax=Alkalibacillus haloalkaliphilus TaxID=94136 RepID=A0A511W6M6_9BACI|nr:BREX-3 system P-loop-containing protein BrxF [Alkalibacillus haloalkaliphilus]GEN46749.1 hypothetical protein AHA02nite_25250 [Alkalibacillus haloalkaliphilus]